MSLSKTAPSALSPQDRAWLEKIPGPLLRWYDQSARALPWRKNRDPYRIWVSEVMLQQTRVEAVIPYYERFLCRFPTLQSLAEAPQEELLKLWEGMGYYSRARSLQKAAQLICREAGGVFPDSYDRVRALPGVGPYTAGAICSIAFEQAVPAVDGNVMRVVSRLLENAGDPSSPTARRAVADALQKVYPAGRCGDFTQSLMELGATVCLPGGAPECAGCPLASFCRAFDHGTQADFPVRISKKPRRILPLTVFRIVCEDRTALRRRPAEGLLAGLWELPNAEGFLPEPAAEAWLYGHGLRPTSVRALGEKRHVFTHVEWRMLGYDVSCPGPCPDFVWVQREALAARIMLPTAFKKFL